MSVDACVAGRHVALPGGGADEHALHDVDDFYLQLRVGDFLINGEEYIEDAVLVLCMTDGIELGGEYSQQDDEEGSAGDVGFDVVLFVVFLSVEHVVGLDEFHFDLEVFPQHRHSPQLHQAGDLLTEENV